MSPSPSLMLFPLGLDRRPYAHAHHISLAALSLQQPPQELTHLIKDDVIPQLNPELLNVDSDLKVTVDIKFSNDAEHQTQVTKESWWIYKEVGSNFF